MGVFESFIGVNFWTALFTLLNFLAVLYVGKRFLWGPVMKIIQDRQQEIDDMYANAGAAEANAQAMEQEYKEKLSVAAATGERIVKDAVARAQSREEEILRQANADAAAIMDKAAADIAMEKKKDVMITSMGSSFETVSSRSLCALSVILSEICSKILSVPPV